MPEKNAIQATNIFSVMSALAVQYKAINLAQGFPDFAIDERLAKLLYEAVQENFNQYAPMPGLSILREAIADDFKMRYSVFIKPDAEITITPGATYGIYTCLASILKPDDEVIVLEPAYDSYIPNIESLGCKPVPVSLSMPSFRVDWQRVRAAITQKTRAIIINTPHNPTGSIWQNEDWNELANMVRDSSIIVVSDEVYEQLVFDHARHYSVLEHKELRNRSFAIFSFGKVFNNTGWKVGYVIAPEFLTNGFRKLHQYLSFSVNTPAQYALAKYLTISDRPKVGELMQAKRDYFLSLMADLPFTMHRKSTGSYFQTMSYEQISNLPDIEFAEWLTKNYGVATIPLSPFYADRTDSKMVRFCFAKKEETLLCAVERLTALKDI
ncbi:MAG: aminotransferase class I/II-fold pyridoxal phosphate-dependent enzyme [Bacteroidetes bacterium]|nr:aminotransferase class I/II-fold pyridoxal phosphate-dependent enzyme [Bacteroidota bacterium]MBS1739290.1 aminotransferase class I/II-fold pyridoxal phosphate-dependent enzyme [Bacteroidota bacterium]